MTIKRGDRVVQTSIVDGGNVGKIYEVGDITGRFVIIRDIKTKIAVLAIDIDEFDKCYTKYLTGWTDWEFGSTIIIDGKQYIFAYRTNGKKVQVKSGSYRAESSCNSCDVFDLNIGIELALGRLIEKSFTALFEVETEINSRAAKEHSNLIEAINARQNKLIQMVKSKENA